MIKKHFVYLTGGFFLLAAVFVGAIFIWLFSGESSPADQSSYFLEALNLKGGEDLRSGDIILWSTSSVKSLLVEEMTDGHYSHTAILHQGPEKEFWVLDIYPEKGLRHMRLADYLKESKHPITRVAFLRYQFELDVHQLEESIRGIVRPDHTISFNENMIYSKTSLEDIYKKDSSTSLYCTELVLKLLEKAAGRPIQIDNDFERVMAKWQMVKEGKQVNGLSPITAVKKFYLRAKLGNLKNSPEKKLFTPNGLARSSDFKVLREAQSPYQAGSMKKSITHMPDLPDPVKTPEVQK